MVALALVFLPGVVVSMFAGPIPAEEWPFALLYGLLLAAPFAYLGLDGTKDWLPWLVAVLLTALFWGALAASVIISAREQSGVNIGMGMAMLASPFVTTLGTWAANRHRS
jgi:hypothetical protein